MLSREQAPGWTRLPPSYGAHFIICPLAQGSRFGRALLSHLAAAWRAQRNPESHPRSTQIVLFKLTYLQKEGGSSSCSLSESEPDFRAASSKHWCSGESQTRCPENGFVF